MHVRCLNTTHFVKFIVADIDSTPIIGLNTKYGDEPY